jgi:hypothetical protein
VEKNENKVSPCFYEITDLKGHGNEADFHGIFAETGSS